MKKIFIALLLCAITVCTWAATTYSFGNNGKSKWIVGYSNDVDLRIEVNHKNHWKQLELDWSGNIQVSHGNQKKIVIVGPITTDFIKSIINNPDGTYGQCFAGAFSLDMSGATYADGKESDWASLKSQLDALWNNKYGWAHTVNNVMVGKIYYPGDVVIKQTAHVTPSSSFEPNDVCDIHRCGDACTHILKDILSEAGITNKARLDLVRIHLFDDKNKVVESVKDINAFTLDLSSDTTITSWANITNQYVSNVILPYTVGDINNAVAENFNKSKLYNVIVYKFCDTCDETLMNAYIHKPGFFATGLQYVNALNPKFILNTGEIQWYNVGIENHNGKGYKYDTQTLTKLKLSGYVFARDIKNTSSENVDADGHLIPYGEPKTINNDKDGTFIPGRCTCELAPSYKEIGKTVHYCPEGTQGYPHRTFMSENAQAGQVSVFDFTDAQFGYVDDNGVFQYYPADMTLSELQYFKNSWRSVAEVKLPTSPTQYIIPEAFLFQSQFVREICIPCNYKEIHRYAFLGEGLTPIAPGSEHYVGGITHYTTTAAKDDELKGILKGDTIDYGEKSLTLPSTTEYLARGAFHGYDGAALLEDVYVLAEKAPICEFFAFDQKTYVGDNFAHSGHLIRKRNYVDANMAMLHFPNTSDRIEMLNYSDMTRKYRLYDETGHYDNVGNLLVWPTQSQYNRSFNQALAGVTWWAWKENLDGIDNPEAAYSAGTKAGGGYQTDFHENLFLKAAADDGFSDTFAVSYGKNPHVSFDGSYSKGEGFDDVMKEWDRELLENSEAHNPTDRPLSYNWIKYGGWHQFVIAELYDFMLDDPTPGPKPDYYNFAKYNKNIWYAVCFPFNLTKAQLLKALGNPETKEYPYISTLSGVNRDPEKLKISVHMSKNLLKNKIVYDEKCPNTVKCDKSTGYQAKYEAVNYGDDDIVMEANKPYFILPALPEEEIIKAAREGEDYNRKSEISVIEQPEKEEDQIVMFPVATHVHAVNGSFSAYINGEDEEVKDTTYAYNYYFVGNYIPQEMPLNAYYLAEYKKSNGDWWSSFYYNNPKKEGKMWLDNDAIVIAVIEDNASGHARSKGHFSAEELEYGGKIHNFVWKDVNPHNDGVFFYGTGHDAYAKSAFGIQMENNYTTSIVLPEDFETPESDKVYNLNGQFVGTDSDKMAKGIYIVGGKKVVK